MSLNIKPKSLFLGWIKLLFVQKVKIEEQGQDAKHQMEVH